MKFLVASTAALAAVLLSAGCGLDPATPSPAEGEVVSPPRKAVEVETLGRPPKEPRMFPMREPTEDDLKGVQLLLILSSRR